MDSKAFHFKDFPFICKVYGIILLEYFLSHYLISCLQRYKLYIYSETLWNSLKLIIFSHVPFKPLFMSFLISRFFSMPLTLQQGLLLSSAAIAAFISKTYYSYLDVIIFYLLFPYCVFVEGLGFLVHRSNALINCFCTMVTYVTMVLFIIYF